MEHRFEDFYEFPNDYTEFFRLGYIKNANRTLRPQFENLETLRFYLEQYIKNNEDVLKTIVAVINNRIGDDVYRTTTLNRASSRSHNDDHGFGIAIDNENAAALRNRNSAEINNKNFNSSLLHLINQQDISNLPIFNEFFDQICEVWLW